MALEVTPANLRDAAKVIGQGWKPPTNPANAFTLAAIPIARTDTAGALREAGAAVAAALTTLKGRQEQFQHVLTVSANAYDYTEEDAAARIEAIGSLNDAPHRRR